MKYYSRLILAFGTGLFFLFSPVQAQAPDFTPTTAGEITDSVTENSLSSVILSEQGESKNLVPADRDASLKSSESEKMIPRRTEGLPLSLILPLSGPSIHTNYTGSADTFAWTDINSGKATTYGVIDDQFIYQPNDTWFVYGLFGPIEAVNYDYNVKYLEWGGRHNGIDLATTTGTPVISASGGEVVFTGTRAGNTIVVQTGDFQITYSHLSKISVSVEEKVTQGQIIGLTGKSGTTNPHLHFQIDQITGGERWAINPVKYLLPELQTAIMPDVPANRYADNLGMLSTENFRW
ncbi:hypothetical protein A3K24_00350 [candidate division Kazan bacterium RIFCSPHIGHO2_01_FULL_44_14]|uniref:M23ase beta-sheet core domain-containing protein n=1 Tax=candidate division Kazan bacterium RIFCSPLOWO2_01_FULL_45_19 TaxID=1798538 RepID=A0A1F4NPU7_UNCK3|nr:MAG: hypothetical protein A3K51_00350 [candidate division Kazan bacterium RIFCSPLOWO2_01_FULL_45_19]OGB77563.1 MAG: hypothetical protein A3K24_00350 [candidate division Kazan bacterium RIFCSPHIGHO2_01_FULL_44_14]